MCPICIANIAVLAATSSGGVAALGLRIFRSEKKQEERQKYETSRNGNTESGLIARMGDCTTTATREGEEIDPCPRRAGRRASANAVGRGRKRLRVRRAQGQGQPARSFRWPTSVDRLSRV